eukprot:3853968-Pyramimonas_sp.AAC.1
MYIPVHLESAHAIVPERVQSFVVDVLPTERARPLHWRGGVPCWHNQCQGHLLYELEGLWHALL